MILDKAEHRALLQELLKQPNCVVPIQFARIAAELVDAISGAIIAPPDQVKVVKPKKPAKD